MSTREFFVKRWEMEQPAFIKVLRAIPQGQLQYRPHERCTAAGALAWQLAEEQKQLSDLLVSGEARVEPRECPPTATDIVKAWDDATNQLRTRLRNVDDKKWAEPATLMMGEGKWSDTMENMFWGYLFDMVHHRGQLSSYLRPMGGKVPAIYGPSADDKG